MIMVLRSCLQLSRHNRDFVLDQHFFFTRVIKLVEFLRYHRVIAPVRRLWLDCWRVALPQDLPLFKINILCNTNYVECIRQEQTEKVAPSCWKVGDVKEDVFERLDHLIWKVLQLRRLDFVTRHEEWPVNHDQIHEQSFHVLKLSLHRRAQFLMI
jgi:hypothetical protein